MNVTSLLPVLALLVACGGVVGRPSDTGETAAGAHRDADGDGWGDDVDCDDRDPNIHPAVAEDPCGRGDEDCDGAIDEDVDLVWYVDVDGDGFGDPDGGADRTCRPSGPSVPNAADCDDADASAYPGADEVCDGRDANCDGAADTEWDADGDGFAACVECDDADATVYPNPDVPEVWYDGEDQNCDGNDADQDGDGFAVADYAYSLDRDGDGVDELAAGDCWDDPRSVPTAFTPVNGRPPLAAAEVSPGAADTPYDDVDADCGGDDDFDADEDAFPTDAWPNRDGVRGTDCDDLDPNVNPAAVELWYTGIDEACDGGSDFDRDGDGDDADTFGGGDCEDGDPAVNAFVALEDCATEADDDCDGDPVDVGDAVGGVFVFVDADRDGWGADGTESMACALLAPYDATVGGDCDDADGAVNPESDDPPGDGVDANCDGVDDCFEDLDGDGWGDGRIASADADCDDPGEAYVGGDCDEADATVNPGVAEGVADGVDADCDGIELCWADADGDGVRSDLGDTVASIDLDCDDGGEGADADPTGDCDDADSGDFPGATEITANGDDEDCDGGEVCYEDDDDDGYLDASGDTRASSDTDCADANEGTNADPTTDCDEADSGANPGATEIIGSGADEDCDGVEVCNDDGDDDGFLDASGATRVSTDADCADANEGTNTDPTTDCDDADSGDYGGATEIVGNGDDESCDGVEVCYDDDDNDGYLDTAGDTRSSTDTDCADANEGTNTDLTTDCDDTSATDYPGATETVGNGDDEDCDNAEICYDDDDDDGYLDTARDTRSSTDTDCADANEGTSTDLTTDCDDADADDYPGATETVGNGDDESCDGAEVCYDDDDNDGYLDTAGDTRASSDTDCSDANEGTNTDLTTDCDDTSALSYPGAIELCDGAWNNCAASWSSDDGVVHRYASGVYTSVSASGTLAAQAGQYVFCDGTYAVAINVASSVNVNFRSRNGAGSTVLTGSSSTRPILNVTGSGAVVTLGDASTDAGFTLSSGSGYFDGTSRYGGDVYVSGGAVSAYACTIEAGAGDYGGGVAVVGGSFDMVDGEITANSADFGGGLYVSGAPVSLSDVEVSGNYATDLGGGAYVRAGGELTCLGASTRRSFGFITNDATYSGGVHVVSDGSVFDYDTCDFGSGSNDNAASAALDVGVGGATSRPSFDEDGYGDDVTGSCTSTGCAP